jgi:flagellar motility protein MotE (MotC chaperone)
MLKEGSEMADTNIEGSSSYSLLERILIWFVIPFVFTAVLLGVLLSIFDYDIKGSVQKALHGMPLIGSIVPAPKEKEVNGTTTTGKSAAEQQSLQNKDDQIAELNAKVQELETALQKSDSVAGQKDQGLKDAEAKSTQLEEQLKTKTQSDEEYKNQITQLASIYANMSPSKAAPIIENLTLKERVLVFNMMKADKRGPILEKMDPKKAAEASIGMKDAIPVKDQEIAALQERLNINGANETASPQKVSKADLALTFANMTPKNAASVLLEMQRANSEKALGILTAMDNASRSKVMTALSDLSKETAAALTAKLAQ